MTRQGKLRLKLLTVSLMAVATFSHSAEAAAKSAMSCPENVVVDSCDAIPGWLYAACAGCNRPVGCSGPGLLPPLYEEVGYVAGCEFET
jgi:hypothetical protein